MNVGKMFPSKWLSASDFEEGEDQVATIRGIKYESVGRPGEEEEKPVLYFREFEKGMVLNKTNTKTIAKIYGDESDEWSGKRVSLFVTEVDFQGNQTLAIRVRSRAPKGDPKLPPVAAKPSSVDSDDDDTPY